MKNLIRKATLKVINSMNFRIAFSHNPLFTFAYPKSGVSYLSLYINLLLGEGYKINPFLLNENMREFLDYDRHLKSGVLGIDENKNIKIYKTHQPYKKYMKNIICLTRNPRISIPSHYRFLKERNQLKNLTFEEFALGRNREIDKWGKLYRNYLSADESASFGLIKYEDIKLDEMHIINLLKDVFGIFPINSIKEMQKYKQLTIEGSKILEEKLDKFDLRILFSNKYKFTEHKLDVPEWSQDCEKELRKYNNDLLEVFNYN